MLVATGGLLAQEKQEKYEYATVHSSGMTIYFTTAENQESIPTGIKGKEYMRDLLKKVNELTDKGWEVYNSTFTDNVTIMYYLRKKKN
jgi:hypothetical protein